MLALAILLQIFASVLSCGKFRQRIQERRLLEDEREGTTRLVIIYLGINRGNEKFSKGSLAWEAKLHPGRLLTETTFV